MPGESGHGLSFTKHAAMTTAELHERRDALIAYLLTCVTAKDWHGVSDAANDIRVIDAMIGERDANS